MRRSTWHFMVGNVEHWPVATYSHLLIPQPDCQLPLDSHLTFSPLPRVMRGQQTGVVDKDPHPVRDTRCTQMVVKWSLKEPHSCFWLFLKSIFMRNEQSFPYRPSAISHLPICVFHCWLSWEKTCFDFIQNPRYQAHIHCASWLICHKKGLSMRRSFPKSILLMLRTMKINKDNCTSGRKYKLLLDFQGYSQSVKNRNKLGFSALGSILDASPSPCSTIFLPVFWPSSELGFLGFSYQGFGFFYQFILFYIFPLFLHNFLSLLFLVSFSDIGIMSCLLISHFSSLP